MTTLWYELPELSIAILALITLGVCFYTWFAWQEYAAVGWMFPSALFAALYLWIWLYNPDDESRRIWVRGAVFITLINIIIWRVVYILRQKRINTWMKQ